MNGAATGMALFFASTGVAFAQDTTSGDEEVVIVTGFRASLENSINLKRNETSIVEAVSAEDIGRLPDNSIAEALARLPGLTAQRLFGRANVISVRGLSPDFTTALLNGREQVSAGDNRGVEFDQYPSELLSSVVVYKTPDASLIGQGLAGTADMRTVRPLSMDGRTFAVSARYEWNDIGALNAGTEEQGYRITGSYIDQSANGEWGWAIGVATNSSPTQAERWEAWGYPDVFRTPGNTLTTDGSAPNTFVGLGLGGAKPYVQSSLLERTGVMGVLQYQPSDNFSTTVDVFYSDFEETQTLRGIELPLFWSGAVADPDDVTVEDGLITAGSFSNVEAVVRNDIRSRESTVQAIGWNAELSGELWSFMADLSYSKVERHDTDLETYAGTGFGAGNGATDTLDYMQGGGGGYVFNSILDYADPTLILLT